ncbi:MAG: hypothetical protein IKA86_01350 [Paraprevotella sp.]|nr:hypothetical protein [Paraprevotella sp.]MBQ8282096.1 hypothetical protein [Paraprevotella sp.]MBR2379634.1 hypothetical protein [Paraprevotella sp.]
MIRTFHSKIDKKALLLCVLPAAALLVYFFWNRMPLPVFFCAVFLVFVIERMLHTDYVFTDEGILLVRRGRFARVREVRLADIDTVEMVQPSPVAFLRNKDTVLLTMKNGAMLFVTPFPAEEFCRYMEKKRQEMTDKTNE